MNEFPSASFVATEFGAPAPEGICVVAVDKNQKTFPGAALQQDVCNADVQAAAKKAVEMIDAQSNGINSIQLVQVVQASSQVVAGIKWTLTIAAGLSSCPKTSKYSLCAEPVAEGKRDLYKVTVIDKAWMTPRYTLSGFDILSSSAKYLTPRSTLDGSAEDPTTDPGTESNTKTPHHVSAGAIGPAWTYDSSVEKPAGTKDMGSWQKAVYTSEQQARLGVDEQGQKVSASVAFEDSAAAALSTDKPMLGGMHSGSIGPAWTYDTSVEKPAGSKDMGNGVSTAVYTSEQQGRLGVDAEGKKLDGAGDKLETAAPKAASANVAGKLEHSPSGGIGSAATAGIVMLVAGCVVALVGALVVSQRRKQQNQAMRQRTRLGEAVQTTSSSSDSEANFQHYV